MKCPRCNDELMSNNEYCSNCGWFNTDIPDANINYLDSTIIDVDEEHLESNVEAQNEEDSNDEIDLDNFEFEKSEKTYQSILDVETQVLDSSLVKQGLETLEDEMKAQNAMPDEASKENDDLFFEDVDMEKDDENQMTSNTVKNVMDISKMILIVGIFIFLTAFIVIAILSSK